MSYRGGGIPAPGRAKLDNAPASPEWRQECRRHGNSLRVPGRLVGFLGKVAHELEERRALAVEQAGVAKEALVALEVDEVGLDAVDRMLLSAIVEKFSGGPVGLETLAAAVSEDTETIEDVYEPYLLQEGFLQRTPRGRIATERAYKHLGFAAPQRATLWDETTSAG